LRGDRRRSLFVSVHKDGGQLTGRLFLSRILGLLGAIFGPLVKA
jgi:hypothetical protein